MLSAPKCTSLMKVMFLVTFVVAPIVIILQVYLIHSRNKSLLLIPKYVFRHYKQNYIDFSTQSKKKIGRKMKVKSKQDKKSKLLNREEVGNYRENQHKLGFRPLSKKKIGRKGKLKLKKKHDMQLKHLKKKEANKYTEPVSIETKNMTNRHFELDFVSRNRDSASKFFTSYDRKVNSVDCQKIMNGDEEEISRSHAIHSSVPDAGTPANVYLELAQNCSRFRFTRGFINSAMTEKENNFPIAFSILMFVDIEQTERLLRAIYRPQNYFCIHVDIKSGSETIRAIKAIASCFPNVFVASRLISVKWGTYDILEADLICMEDLWKKKSWKYFINLTGQEFPIRTNSELVEILDGYKGASSVAVARPMPERWEAAGPPPHKLTPKKGSVHIAVSRDFVDFALHSRIAKDLMTWTKKTRHGSETFFNTLAHNKQLGVAGTPPGGVDQLRPNRYKNWRSSTLPCAGKYVRDICILGTGDLPLVTRSPALFANKFHLNYQPIALDCMEEWYFNRTREDYFKTMVDFNATKEDHLKTVVDLNSAKEEYS